MRQRPFLPLIGCILYEGHTAMSASVVCRGVGKPMGPAGEGAWPDEEAWAGGAACTFCFAAGTGTGCPSRLSAAASGAGSACAGNTANPSSTACPSEDPASASASWKTSSNPQACKHSLLLQGLPKTPQHKSLVGTGHLEDKTAPWRPIIICSLLEYRCIKASCLQAIPHLPKRLLPAHV